MSEFVDANVFLRLLTQDDPVKATRVLGLLERAERGDVRLVTSEAIVAEVVFVLSSPVLYHFPKPQVASILEPVLENPGLTIDHKQAVLSALSRFGQMNLDFEDCLAIAHIDRQGLDGIYSYDRHFDRAPVQRLEP